jgi:formamidopyrimidine-DNA glycosylase
MVDVLVEAIRHEGSTLSDGTYRTAMNNPGNYQNEHRVYDREDMPCRTCKQPVRRIVQAQRSSFFCPRCQVI